jgi:mercuric reductase
MSSESYDLIVIGAGSAARDAAGKAAREHGASVAMIERTRWGGSCPNVACKPTKAYLVVAKLAHDINHLAGELGIDVGPATANLARIRARKDTLVGTQEAWAERLHGAGYETVKGEASFVDGSTIRVGDRLLSSERILIATGSRTAVPPVEGIAEIDWIDHISALDLEELPESLLVLGAGAVGLEFGQAFARFGSRVTIVDAEERISPKSDADATSELTAAFEEEGIEVVTNTFVKKVERDGGEIVATLAPRDGSPERELRVAKVLVSSGRKPNVEELELETAGVETTKLGIAVDERLRTSAPGIWAAGDVTAIAQFTPVAQYQARIAVDDMFGNGGRTADYTLLPTSIFTDPELAGIGLTEEEAREAGYDVGAESYPVSNTQRASYLNIKHGLYKVVYDRTSRKVLGVHVVARGASDIVQGLALGLKYGATIDDLAHVHHAFPTFGEGVKAAAEKAAAAAPSSATLDG